MTTPICDFVNKYISDNTLRLHMPGHKGHTFFGIEPFDITEISGADSLFEASGIIKASENNASCIFETGATFYSTEGSSLCIRAMLHLAVKYAISIGKTPHIIAGRNSHKAFISAMALLDPAVSFIPEQTQCSYLSCTIDFDALEKELKSTKATALYVTSPDYLGNTVDIPRLSKLCHDNGAILIVDNAHGAYLKFTSPSRHPIDLGADMCCDSAHKTLPVLTGGAYLHISQNAPDFLAKNARGAMALFASTSPSYLILQSLDMANVYLTSYPKKLNAFIERLSSLVNELRCLGFDIVHNEPLKLTFMTKSYGYTGEDFAKKLRERGLECEFSDKDHLVLMLTPENENDLDAIFKIISGIEKEAPITDRPPALIIPQRVISIREAVFSSTETVSASDSLGRTLALLNVGCPPAVPIAICGEKINSSCIELFDYYGIEFCNVVADK